VRKRFIGLTVGSAAGLALFLVPASAPAAPAGPSGQGAAVAVAAPVRPAVAAAPVNDCVGFAASSPQTRVVTDDFARTVASTLFTTLPCGTTSVSIPRGRTALIVAHVDAEVSCRGPVNQWCIGRVLIGGVEGEPNAPEPDSFAWATARADLDQWEANGFTRTRRFTCSRLSRTTCVVSVITQVRNHASGMTMRIDDRTLHVQANF
jgi:hypothetical protein